MFSVFLTLCVLMSALFGAFADDAAGLLCVHVETNGNAVVEMPFAPYGNAKPDAFLSGPVVGGGGVDPDRLYVLSSNSLTYTNAVYSQSAGWLDPATGEPTPMTASQGDTVVFAPSLCGTNEPFSFFLYGQALGLAVYAGAPRIRSMTVDPFGAFAELSVFSRGLTTDLYLTDFSTNASESTLWRHMGRYPGCPMSFSWRDSTLPSSGGRIYLASDATRDSDGDGIPDEMELLIFGTSPHLADTDGDGICDTQELAWGCNPLVAEVSAPKTLFAEPFEPPAVEQGIVSGQNGWNASVSVENATVQGEIVYEGRNAVELQGSVVSHSVTSSARIVWVDMHIYVEGGLDDPENIPDKAVVFFTLDGSGHPIMADGTSLVTNQAYAVNGWRKWTRCTAMQDYSSQTWDLYVDGVIVGEGLAFRRTVPSISSIEMQGSGAVDDIVVSTSRPEGLSSDGDCLPDEWEMERFGDLSHDGSGDADRDGMNDLEEFRVGTDPLAPNGDTDGDGLPDWWEAANGLNPFGTNDFPRSAFRETFESPEVETGDIMEQNGWTASRSGAATVQTNRFRTGSASLEIKGGNASDGDLVHVSHSARSHAEVVWMDLWQIGTRGFDSGVFDGEAIAAYAFDNQGHPILSDGSRVVTNAAVRVENEDRWTRCSCRLDFPNRVWDFYLDGVLVSSGLAMRGDSGAIHSMSAVGGGGYLDDIYIGFARPQGLSSDGDALPDEWEFRNLGDLSGDGTDDLDGDGLSDLEEFSSGTDPSLADTDGDGMSDLWETENGLNPLDPADAVLDPDGDGLTCLKEFELGTDPRNPDVDGDGIPDGWEVDNGTDPFTSDASQDPDGDGLTNVEEMFYGTDPHLADTDNDGVRDAEECKGFFSDPLNPDFDGTAVTNMVIHAVAVDSAIGDWYANEDCVMLSGRTGEVFYDNDLIIENTGFYQIRAMVSSRLATDAEFVCRVDGCRVGTVRLPSSKSELTADAVYNLPWISAGVHTLSFELQNFANSAEFGLGDICVCSIGGPDSDANGVADWMDSRHAFTGSERGVAIRSKVSPFCLRVRSATAPAVMFSNATLDVRPLPNHGWWTDVALNTNSATLVQITYENGFKKEDVSVEWGGFDVMKETDIIVRAGDSLLLTVNGEGSITVGGKVVAKGLSPTVPYRFATSGKYAVAGTVADTTKVVTVTVVECSLSGEHPTWRGKRNSIRFTGSGLECMSVSWDGCAELVSASVSERQCTGSLSVPQFAHPTAFACEIANPDASVAGSVALKPFWMYYTLEGKYYESQRLEDGTRVVENRLSAFDLPEAVEFRMTSSSGICFENGSGRLTVAPSDFDGYGDFRYRFLVPSGVNHPCQFLHGYFQGKEFAQ